MKTLAKSNIQNLLETLAKVTYKPTIKFIPLKVSHLTNIQFVKTTCQIYMFPPVITPCQRIPLAFLSAMLYLVSVESVWHSQLQYLKMPFYDGSSRLPTTP